MYSNFYTCKKTKNSCLRTLQIEGTGQMWLMGQVDQDFLCTFYIREQGPLGLK